MAWKSLLRLSKQALRLRSGQALTFHTKSEFAGNARSKCGFFQEQRIISGGQNGTGRKAAWYATYRPAWFDAKNLMHQASGRYWQFFGRYFDGTSVPPVLQSQLNVVALANEAIVGDKNITFLVAIAALTPLLAKV